LNVWIYGGIAVGLTYNLASVVHFLIPAMSTLAL